MKVKFIGATEAEDRIVDIPDGTQDVVEVDQSERVETDHNPWPYAMVMIAILCSIVAIVWILVNG